MRKRLGRDFFVQPTIKTAKRLLRKFLIRQVGKEKLVGKIIETEAYIDPDDKASHAFFGKTKRCQPMYGEPGIACVYFIYGMYRMLNVVAEKRGRPCVVLVRALEPVDLLPQRSYGFTAVQFATVRGVSGGLLRTPSRIASGPGKLCQWMKIDSSFNGEDLVKSQKLWVEDRGVRIKRS